MIQRTLFCIFTVIVLVSSQNGPHTTLGNTSFSGIVAQSSPAINSSLSIAPSSERVAPSSVQSIVAPSSLQSSSAIISSSVIASSSEHMDSTSVQSSTTIQKSASLVVVTTDSIMLSSISLVMPSSPVGPVSSATAKTPLLSSPVVPLTSSAAPLVSSAAPMRSSSVIASGVPVVSASPTAVPYPETIIIKNSHGKNCLMASLKAKFKIAYKQKQKNGTTTVTVPLDGNNLTYTGSCDEKIANFNLTWGEHGNKTYEHGNKTYEHSFFMQFENNKTANKSFWIVQKLSAVFDTTDPVFINATDNSIMATSMATSSFGKFADNKTYLCNSVLDFKMKPVTIIFEKIALQPFSNKTKLDKNGAHCPGDKVDDDDDNTVPIAVGAALGGLVLIVLVAYIIGRRRSNRGYEQV